MRSVNVLPAYIKSAYENMVMKELADRSDPAEGLTPEEGRKINAQLKEFALNHINTIPNTKPKMIVEYYKAAFPALKMTNRFERADRKRTQSKAAAAYAESLVQTAGYQEGRDGYARDRMEETSSRLFSAEELQAYKDYCEAGNDVAISRLFVSHIEKNLELFETLLSNPISDDELIENYPKLALPKELMMEGEDLLRKAEACGAITEERSRELRNRVKLVLIDTPMLTNRIALMADPFYPTVRLEAFLEAPADTLEYMFNNDTSNDENPVIEEVTDITYTSSNPPQKKVAEMEAQLANPNHLLHTDNVITIGRGIAIFRYTEHESFIARALRIPVEEMKKTMAYCDKDGKTYPVESNTPDQLLKKTDGELYLISTKGDREPVPITVDPTKDKLTLLVGEDKIRQLDHNTLTPKPTIGVFSRIGSFLSQVFRGRPTETMIQYRKAQKRYEYANIFKPVSSRLAQEGIPQKVRNKNASYAEEARIDSGKDLNSAEKNLSSKEASRIASFEKRLEQLEQNPDYEHVVPAAREVLKNGSPESKRRLVLVHDDNLRKFDLLLKKGDPDALQKGLDAFVERENSPEIQRSKSMELSSSDQPEISKLEAPHAEHSMILGSIN